MRFAQKRGKGRCGLVCGLHPRRGEKAPSYIKTNTHNELETEHVQWNRCGRKARNARRDGGRGVAIQPDKRRDGQPPGAEVWALLIYAHPNLPLHRYQHATMG